MLKEPKRYYEYVKDIENTLEYFGKEILIKEIRCPTCHRIIKIPVVVSDEDRIKFQRLMAVIYRFLEEHPAIQEEYTKDFIDMLLDLFNKYNKGGQN